MYISLQYIHILSYDQAIYSIQKKKALVYLSQKIFCQSFHIYDAGMQKDVFNLWNCSHYQTVILTKLQQTHGEPYYGAYMQL